MEQRAIHGHISQGEIIRGAQKLPAFPRIVQHILAVLDDDGASMNDLVTYLQRDPVITGKVIAMASHGLRNHGHSEVRSVYTAASFLGLQKIRSIVLATSLADFTRRSHGAKHYWLHSLAVGVAAQELSAAAGLGNDYAFVAGLLHDVGQLWLSHFHWEEFQLVRQLVEEHGVPVCVAEQRVFGIDHGEVGRLLADYWELPADIGRAIAQHHAAAEESWENKLLAAIHVAEVLSNGLDLPAAPSNQVTHLADGAVACLGLDLQGDCSVLFGRIEARFSLAQGLLT